MKDKKINFNIKYFKTRDRETIQKAWNRSIIEAEGEYLTFLGVDETIYPEALKILLNEINNTDIDWVMSNSLIISLDKDGVYKKDEMIYDRSNASKDHVLLETCYLSWVGGLYRKDIHDRFGYYDDNFKGAGDTEFKNRILSKINISFINQTLGLFLNYDEERTTASPLIELEDTMAWYLFRTLGGIRYNYPNLKIDKYISVLKKSLNYRKSYLTDQSHDVGFALNLTKHFMKNCEIEENFKDDIKKICSALVRLNNHLNSFFSGDYNLLYDKFDDIKLINKIITKLSNEKIKTIDNIGFNDNKFEQHNWIWK